MGFLGSVGKALGGAIGGFLVTGGNPLGAIAGGIGGLMMKQPQIGSYTPPNVQEAQSIINGLRGQVGKIATSQYTIQKPYLDEALQTFRKFPNTVNQLFGDTEKSIDQRYTSLFDNIQTQMNNQWNKSALGLSALGLYNTPATQLTQTDIVNNLYGRIAEEKTQALNSLDVSELNSLIDYYNRAPSFLASISDAYANLDPEIKKYQLQLQLAGVLNGLNTAIYPQTSPLSKFGEMINTALLTHGKDLPSWSSVKDKFSSIFGGNSSHSFTPPTPSYGLVNTVNSLFKVPKIF